MPSLKSPVLFQPFEKEELLVGSPLMVEKWEVKFVEDVVVLGVLLLVGEAGGTVVSLRSEQLGGLADITLALVTLDFIGGIHYVLDGGRFT